MQPHVVRADPAGNITLFVLDAVPKAERPALAARLMSLPGWEADQVGFVCAPDTGLDGRLEMTGGEFCGNAARAFGMLLAKKRGLKGAVSLTVSVSGCDHPLRVDIDTIRGTSRVEMPLPRFVRPAAPNGIEGTLVHLDGIAHFIVENAAPALEVFSEIEPVFRDCGSPDAYGVMFLSKDGHMTPLVRVPAAGTLIWEGSCGSGSLAAALAQSEGMENGVFERDYIQPAGTVRAFVTRKNGAVVAAAIGGTVTIGDAAVPE